MTFLFVAPNPLGSGEALTALDMAVQVAASGHDVRFAGSPLTARLVAHALPCTVLDEDPAPAARAWTHAVAARPDVIVFADYPLLALNPAGRAILEMLTASPPHARLVTLDHLGMARGPRLLPFGPPHLEPVPAVLPPLPAGMTTLLPCPLRSPVVSTPQDGIRFRSVDVSPRSSAAVSREVRSRFDLGDDDHLVFHSAPGWAVEFCRRHGLTYYDHFVQLLERLFGAVRAPITLVSVNGGDLLRSSTSPRLRVRNLTMLSPAEYDALLFASDLFLTDNRISVSLARAACGLIPAVALRNSARLPELLEAAGAVRDIALAMESERLGSVFPFDVFPIWSAADLAALGVFADNPLADAIVTLELFSTDTDAARLAELLEDDAARGALRMRQREYVEQLHRLPSAADALLSISTGS